jgi:ATP-binding cassette subfamily C (CFTR/MRP) protein 1
VLHNSILAALLRSPMSYFDETPTGRLLNRFSKDINTVDEQLPGALYGYLQTALGLLALLAATAYATPMIIVVYVPLAWMYGNVQSKYVAASRDLKRLDSVASSPIYSCFSEALDGRATISGFRDQARIHEALRHTVDYSLRPYFAVRCFR